MCTKNNRGFLVAGVEGARGIMGEGEARGDGGGRVGSIRGGQCKVLAFME